MNPKSAIENYKSSISRSTDADSKGAPTMTALSQSAQDPNAAPKVTALKQSMQDTNAAPKMTALTQSMQNPNAAPQMTAVTQSAQDPNAAPASPSAGDYGSYTAEQINKMFDAQREGQLSSLKAAYDRNIAAVEQGKENVGTAYQEKRNDLAQSYERNRRNFNEQAAASGINTGAGSQASLAMGGQYQRDNTTLGNGEAQALGQLEQQKVDMKTQYEADVNQAISTNDYQKAAALLDQYKQNYSMQLTQAQTLASFGDFSGYAAIYGEAQAENMKSAWAAQNPDLAYRTGAITADQYKQWTGYYPAGYTSYSSGGYSYYGGGGGGNMEPSSDDTDKTSGGKTGISRKPTDPYLAAANASKAQADGIMRTAQIEAQQAGYAPGSAAYNAYVNQRANAAGYSELSQAYDSAYANSAVGRNEAAKKEAKAAAEKVASGKNSSILGTNAGQYVRK